KFYDAEAKERQREHGDTAPGKPKSVVENLPPVNGKARDQAGKAVGVSGKSIDHATKVRRGGTIVPTLGNPRTDLTKTTRSGILSAPDWSRGRANPKEQNHH